MIGATVIDTALENRRGIIIGADPERLDVLVSWRAGQVTTLRVADIRAGRYQIVLP